MNPDILLNIAAVFVSFLLKTTLAFGVCWVFSWLANSPNSRFMIWLGFLSASAAYWLWLAKDILANSSMSGSVSYAPVQLTTSTVGVWKISSAWASPLSITFRCMGIFYLLVVAYLLFTHIKRQRHLKWVLGFTSKPPIQVAEMFQPLAKNLHVSRSRLLVLSGATSPATFGWLRPVILLPDLCLEQDPCELEDILRHELHHVRRWDFVSNGFAVVCRALLFFHPASWYAVRKIQFERELACDLAVVSNSPTRRASYAECLIHFAQQNLSQNPKAWGIDFAASSEHLKARVHSILADSKRSSGWILCLRTACGLALLMVFLSAAPSLAVLFSYTQQKISRPFPPAVRTSYSTVTKKAKVVRKFRWAPQPAITSKDTITASMRLPEAVPPMQSVTNPPTYSKVKRTSPVLSAADPELLHRSAAGNSSVSHGEQQSVTFINPDTASQNVQSGHYNTARALQQSVLLAAGVYKQLSSVKAH